MITLEIIILTLLVILIGVSSFFFIKFSKQLYLIDFQINKFIKTGKKPVPHGITLFGNYYDSTQEAARDFKIPSSTLFMWLSKYDINEVERKIKEYEPGATVFNTQKIIIDGHEFSGVRETAKKLNVKVPTFEKWYKEGNLEEKLKENGIDYKKILGIENQEVKEEYKSKKSNKIRISDNKIKISNMITPKYQIKYGVKPGDEFDSYKSLADYIGISVNNIYVWEKKRFIEIIK